jgi:transcriptional regulator with XRE-family HTH domain
MHYYDDFRYMDRNGPRWMRARFEPQARGLKQFSKELKVIRQDFGYTREELGSIMGCSSSLVAHWEQGRGISKRDLRQLDNLFDTVFVEKYGAIVG